MQDAAAPSPCEPDTKACIWSGLPAGKRLLNGSGAGYTITDFYIQGFKAAAPHPLPDYPLSRPSVLPAPEVTLSRHRDWNAVQLVAPLCLCLSIPYSDRCGNAVIAKFKATTVMDQDLKACMVMLRTKAAAAADAACQAGVPQQPVGPRQPPPAHISGVGVDVAAARGLH